jgi:hypothetical protein
MADTKISRLAAVGSVVATQEFPVNDSGISRKATASQIKDYVLADATFDLSVTGDVSLLTRAAFLTSDIPAATKAMRTQGYGAAGDGGHALYKRIDAAPTATTNVAYVRSTDRYKADGTTDATNGGYWQLVPEGGTVRIEQFGGKADWVSNASPGTDNYQPLLDAIALSAWTNATGPKRYAHRIRFDTGNYRMSSTVYLYDHVTIEGNSTFEGEETTLQFPNNVSGFVFHQNNTGPGGTGLGENGGGAHTLGESSTSTLRGLTLNFAGSGWTTDLTKKAIYARTTIHLDTINIFSAPGKGVYYKAYAGAGNDDEGNCNQWTVRNLFVHSCKGDAFHVKGADVNGGSMVGFVTHTDVGGCGIRNESYFANAYHGMQITGYGNKGVTYLSKRYVLIHPDGGLLVASGGTTPGTDNHKWYYMEDGGATSRYIAWVDDGSHVLQNPIYDPGTGSAYYNPYCEADGTAVCQIVDPSMAYGGNIPTTIYSNYAASNSSKGGGLTSQLGIASGQIFRAGTAEYTQNGASAFVRLGGANESNGYGSGGGLNLMTFRRQTDGDTSWEWGYKGNDLYFSMLNQKPIWEITTPTTTRVNGRALAQPHYLILSDPVIQDPADSSGARVISMRDAAPTAKGTYARGDRYFNVNPSPSGTEGWVCTTSGAIANLSWSSGMLPGGGDYVSTSSGRIYKNDHFGGSTIEPSHLSGTVTSADGMTWTYAGASAPVFKTFGSISA